MSPKPYWALAGLFWPILGGAGRKIFLSPFGPKLAKFISKKLHYFDSQRVRDPQKPKIDPVDPPPSGPHFGPFCVQKGRFWGQKTRFSQKTFFAPNHFLSLPRWCGTLKNQIWPFIPPNGPHLVPFCGHFGPIWGQKTGFSQKIFFAPYHFLSVPRWSGALKNPKLALYTP